MKLGQKYKIVKDDYWKVIVFYNQRQLYYYIFDTQTEAENKLNELI